MLMTDNSYMQDIVETTIIVNWLDGSYQSVRVNVPEGRDDRDYIDGWVSSHFKNTDYWEYV